MAVLAWQSPARANQHDRHAETVHVNRDLTYTMEWESDWTLTSDQGLGPGSRAVEGFIAGSQSLEVLEAYVTTPDGRRIDVEADGVYTRPNAVDEHGPGFVDQQETTVYFPGQEAGARTHIRWRLRQLVPAVDGFNDWLLTNGEDTADVLSLDVYIPADIPVQWAQRGGYEVKDTTADGIRHIAGTLRRPWKAPVEDHGVNVSDYDPVFVVTTNQSLDDLGAKAYRDEEAAGRRSPSPRVAALAARIVGDREGVEAARAISDWVTSHLTYVALYASLDEGLIPHGADEILDRGYGDCKDHVALMQALLRARGIRAEAAAVQVGNRHELLPAPIGWQFNHVILHLPDLGIYTDPTAHSAPFGVLTRSVAGKTVVLIREGGGHAVLPAPRPEDYRYERTANLRLDDDGVLHGTAKIGMSEPEALEARMSASWYDSETAAVEAVLAASREDGTGTFTTIDPPLKSGASVMAYWSSPGLARMDGRSAAFPLPLGFDFEGVQDLRSLLSPQDVRHTPLDVGVADHAWETHLAVPAGWSVTELPPDVETRTSAGTYTATYARTKDGLQARRHLVIDRDVYAADEYDDVQRLFRSALADARTIVTITRREIRDEKPGSDPAD